MVGTQEEIVEPLLERTLGLGFDHAVIAVSEIGAGRETGGLRGLPGLSHAGITRFAREVFPMI